MAGKKAAETRKRKVAGKKTTESRKRKMASSATALAQASE